MFDLDPSERARERERERARARRSRNRGRALVWLLRLVVAAVVFFAGLAVGRALESGGESADTNTTVRTLEVTTLTPQETVTVTAEGPIVDTKTSTIDSRLDSQLLAKLPTTRDAFYDLALSTPGMFAGSGAPAASTEFQSPTAYGSATNENVFLINGVDATSPRSGAFGALVNVNYDAVEEVRIVALGSRAEYGSYSGAAIDVLTTARKP